MAENDTPTPQDTPQAAEPGSPSAPQSAPTPAPRAETVIESMVGEQTGEDGAEGQGSGHNINAMLNVALNVQIVLGQSRMPISQLLGLSRGSVIELDKKIGEPIDVMINDRLVARGDLVKVGENRVGVTLTEIVKDYVTKRS
ncbi:flagellar motor switch protein FliN [Solirhodobacter olei]|uniref:flagellar motor switch protein FliN n=1 Tax=Solirhodobacter olei TaxID=2493082 RepID=UPI000FD70074|nr:flagellar motor switch protein FliN [Solirhodobacter olei]